MTPARVVITGLGANTPLGNTASQTWAALLAGKCGIAPITAFDPAGFPCKLAGQVPPFRVQDYVPKSYRKAVKLMSRDIELSVVAAKEALADARLVTKATDPANINFDPARMAINLGAGLISCDIEEISPAVAASLVDGQFDIRKWGAEGIQLVTPLWLLKYLPNMLACHIGIIHDIQGPSNTITCAEAGGHLAIIEATRIIARGDASLALAGGAEAKVNPILITRQCLLNRATTQNNHNPESACRPFDADANGCVFGEGAGLVTLETIESAKSRDAKIYAEIAGCGQSISINPVYERVEPDGEGIRIAIEKALDDAGISPDDLDLIIPHGTGIPADDLAEAKAIQNALGPKASEIPVLPTKSMLSNTGAASGAIDLIAAASAIHHGRIPAAKNCTRKADGCTLNIITEPLETEIKYALTCSYTYGGQTAAIVLKKPENNAKS
jgi:3-oxoacyl-[acyl-carrier-protein] synthase II